MQADEAIRSPPALARICQRSARIGILLPAWHMGTHAADFLRRGSFLYLDPVLIPYLLAGSCILLAALRIHRRPFICGVALLAYWILTLLSNAYHWHFMATDPRFAGTWNHLTQNPWFWTWNLLSSGILLAGTAILIRCSRRLWQAQRILTCYCTADKPIGIPWSAGSLVLALPTGTAAGWLRWI